jgi:hypothetical protein
MKIIKVESCRECPLHENVIIGGTGKGTQSDTMFMRCQRSKETIDREYRDKTIHFDCPLEDWSDAGNTIEPLSPANPFCPYCGKRKFMFPNTIELLCQCTNWSNSEYKGTVEPVLNELRKPIQSSTGTASAFQKDGVMDKLIHGDSTSDEQHFYDDDITFRIKQAYDNGVIVGRSEISNEAFNKELERRMPKNVLAYDFLMRVLTDPNYCK